MLSSLSRISFINTETAKEKSRGVILFFSCGSKLRKTFIITDLASRKSFGETRNFRKLFLTIFKIDNIGAIFVFSNPLNNLC